VDRRSLAPLLGLLLASCASSSAPSAQATPSASPAASAAASPAAACPEVKSNPPTATLNAAYPVALAFAPDGRLFYAERGGAVKLVTNGAAADFAKVDTVTTERGGGYSERGLLGLAVSPTFAQDHFVYAWYTLTDYAHARVVRWSECNGAAANLTTIVDNLPTGGDCCHKGGRLAFGPDGMLYVTLGENHQANAAQDKCDVRGKVLRYKPDGGVPESGNVCGPVYAYGLRNPFGIAFSADGRMMITNNGPSGDAGAPGSGFDTVDVVEAGANYGWPKCYGYSHPIGGGSCPDGSRGPDWSSEAGASLAPTGATFTSGEAPIAGKFVFCSFVQNRVKVYNGPKDVSDGPAGCQLDVKEGPDHALYFSDTAHIYRFAG
jgi:glucose/arabinose dehydrogenase